MNEQVLSIEQMQTLKELGVDTSKASMCWIRDAEGNSTIEIHDEYCYEMSFLSPIPAFTLQDILKLFEKIKYDSYGFPIFFFNYNYNLKGWEACFRNPVNFDNPEIRGDDMLEVAYQMLVFCLNMKKQKG